MNMNDFIEVLQEKNVPYTIDGDKIFVAENLDLCDTSITSLPNNLKVGRFIHLDPEEITNIAIVNSGNMAITQFLQHG